MFGGLRTRLILLMLLSLLPLGLIALWQTYEVVEDNRNVNRERLAEVTAAAAAEHSAAIQRAIGAGQGLASTVQVNDVTRCRAAMARFVRDNPGFTLVGYVRTDGQMLCHSAGTEPLDYSGDRDFRDAVDRGEIYVDTTVSEAVSRRAVVIIRVPVYNADELTGFMALSLPRTSVSGGDVTQFEDGAVLTGITTSGEVFRIASAPGEAWRHLPPDMPAEDILAAAGTQFYAQNTAGETKLYSVTPPIADSYVVVGSWARAREVRETALAQAAMPLIFALAMWGAGMVVAYFGLNRLVLRHLRDLRSAMRRFALGERQSTVLNLRAAPDEFKDVQRAFNRMAMLITEAEAEKMTDLHDREVLLREVHHRVKNNLQMIGSIMSLQARSARTIEARMVLGDLQRRVRGMAMLHRSLYTQTDTARVDAKELVSEVVADTTTVMTDQSLSIETDLCSVLLYPDQAVPLSMWLAEALTNAVKYVGAGEDGRLVIRIAMRHDGAGEVTLLVENTVNDNAPTQSQVEEREKGTGVGRKLMSAFTRQLGGELTTERKGDRFALIMEFHVQGFDPEAEYALPADAPPTNEASG